MYVASIVLGTCEGLDNVGHGEVVYNKRPKYDVETVASFSCDYGYRISGSNSITCQNSGNWNQAKPSCTQSNKIFFFTYKIQIVNNKLHVLLETAFCTTT